MASGCLFYRGAPLNRGGPLNRGSSEISTRRGRNATLFEYKDSWKYVMLLCIIVI